MMTQQGAVGRGKSVHALLPDALSMFCEKIALILSSGVSMVNGVEALCRNYKNTPYAGAFNAMSESVRDTGILHEALAKAGLFPPYMVQMVKIGEQTGKLDQVMSSLSDYYAREHRIKRSVQHAVVYPACLIGMMAVVILVLVIKVLPIFREVYASLGAVVSGTTSALMNFGMNVGFVVLIAAAAVTLLALAVALLMRTSKRQQVLDLLGKVFPPVRRLSGCMVARRFAYNMALMLESGFPLEEALSLIGGVMDDPHGREKVERCQQLLAEGKDFPDAIEAVGMFDPLHNEMIAIGFLTGKTDKVMEKLADIYQQQMDDDLSRLVSIIEPSMVIVLTVIIGAILMAVMLPMVSIMTSII